MTMKPEQIRSSVYLDMRVMVLMQALIYFMYEHGIKGSDKYKCFQVFFLTGFNV